MDGMIGRVVFVRLSVTLHAFWADEADDAWNVGINNAIDDGQLNPQSACRGKIWQINKSGYETLGKLLVLP